MCRMFLAVTGKRSESKQWNTHKGEVITSVRPGTSFPLAASSVLYGEEKLLKNLSHGFLFFALYTVAITFTLFVISTEAKEKL